MFIFANIGNLRRYCYICHAYKIIEMKLQTPVDCGRSSIGISYKDKVLVLGSCFADNIGQKMMQAGFDVCVNPFGTLYNPMSLMKAMRRLRVRNLFTREDCVPMGAGAGKICSFSHHTSFARDTEEEFLANANAVLEKACDFYQNCNKVIVTLGTSFCYVHGDVFVSNCLKRPAAEFHRVLLKPDESTDLIKSMKALSSGRKFIFTVSPIRHMADGPVLNQISKSSLLLAVNNVCSLYKDSTEYFPAYEIVMDELRDYRFYAEDMVHPSQQTVDYIWERFTDFALPSDELPTLKEREKSYRQSLHRPNLF